MTKTMHANKDKIESKHASNFPTVILKFIQYIILWQVSRVGPQLCRTRNWYNDSICPTFYLSVRMSAKRWHCVTRSPAIADETRGELYLVNCWKIPFAKARNRWMILKVTKGHRNCLYSIGHISLPISAVTATHRAPFPRLYHIYRVRVWPWPWVVLQFGKTKKKTVEIRNHVRFFIHV